MTRPIPMVAVVAVAFAISAASLRAQAGSAAPDSGGTSPSGVLLLDTVVAQALRHNDRALAVRYMEEAAKARIGPAGAWDDPMLMVGVANLPTSFDFREDGMTMEMLGLSQSIPYAGQKGLQAKAAAADAAVAGEDRRQVQLDLITAAKSAYFDLYYRRLTLADLRGQHALLEQVALAARAKLTTGLANQEDVAAAEADVARLGAEILAAEQTIDEASYNLNALRGVDSASPAPALADPPMPIVPDSVAPWLAAAMAHYPPLRRLEHQAEGYGLSAAAARRMQWPMLNLQATYGLRQDTPSERRDVVGVQATLSLPVFAGRQQGQMARAMLAMQRSVDADAAQLWRETEATLRTLHRRAVRLAASLSLYNERIIPAAQEAYESAFAGYSVDRTPFIALLSYATAIYRDRIMAQKIANELARTAAEAERYTTDADLLPAVRATRTR
ncbi:MAG: TolC family protein [Candidatus Zixiibacteriota bacterium]